MKQIQVGVLSESLGSPAGMMLFLARLTQRGHKISTMADLRSLYTKSMNAKAEGTVSSKTLQEIAALPHGTIRRFTPITVAIVGASRRFLAQARTHQVGMTYVSASLQYSDYSDAASFVIPYALLEADEEAYKQHGGQGPMPSDEYLASCNNSMQSYANIASITDNDTAGYAAPQGLRNILIMQGNHQSWEYFIRTRSCNRNTVETQYVTMLIWEALLGTEDGYELFSNAGPDCIFGSCREGSKSCGESLRSTADIARTMCETAPRLIIDKKWPLLLKEDM